MYQPICIWGSICTNLFVLGEAYVLACTSLFVFGKPYVLANLYQGKHMYQPICIWGSICTSLFVLGEPYVLSYLYQGKYMYQPICIGEVYVLAYLYIVHRLCDINVSTLSLCFKSAALKHLTAYCLYFVLISCDVHSVLESSEALNDTTIDAKADRH